MRKQDNFPTFLRKINIASAILITFSLFCSTFNSLHCRFYSYVDWLVSLVWSEHFDFSCNERKSNHRWHSSAVLLLYYSDGHWLAWLLNPMDFSYCLGKLNGPKSTLCTIELFGRIRLVNQITKPIWNNQITSRCILFEFELWKFADILSSKQKKNTIHV